MSVPAIQKKPRRNALSSTTVARAFGFVVKCGRATAFCLFVLGVGLTLAVRTVHGQVGERALTLGRDLAKLSDLLEGTHRVLLNGETIYLASAVTTEDKRAVMDRFEANCQQNSGGLAEEFGKLSPSKQEELARKVPLSWEMRFGMVRRENQDEGMVICVAQPQGGGLRAVVDRLHAVVQKGELGELGNLRYAYVRRTDNGKSHVLMTFTEGHFDLNRVLGRGGEVGGEDPPGAPRPPNGRRILSVSADGAPYGVQSFQTDLPAGEVSRFYQEIMPTLGWTKALLEDSVYHAAIYQRAGVTMTITALELAPAGKTTVTFAEGSPKNPTPSFLPREP